MRRECYRTVFIFFIDLNITGNISNTWKIFVEEKIRNIQYFIKFLGYRYCFVLQTLYKVICVSVIFASYLLLFTCALHTDEECNFGESRGWIYVRREDVLSLSMMAWSIGRYRNYGNVMRANWRILWEPIKTRLLGTEVEFYTSDIREIGYRRILARKIVITFVPKKDQEISHLQYNLI